MSEINTGGPAFPFGTAFSGMTMRDYFAAKALQAILARTDSRFTTTLEYVGGKSYQYADAMLKARNNQGETK